MAKQTRTKPILPASPPAGRRMTKDYDPYRLSSPWHFLLRMIIFLVAAAFIPLILYRQVAEAFQSNPALNALIFFVLFIGIVLALRSVARLIPEVRWVNGYRRREAALETATPRLLAPVATLLRDRSDTLILSTSTWRSLLDSIATRLDENREILRYLTGLLVFLGLLGTFWGLLTTVGAVGGVIQSLNVGSTDAGTVFEELKRGLEAPLAGMGIAFSTSLFGLASSLVLGFLDLQAGQAQNRFYTELEDWLSSLTNLDDLDLETAEAGNSIDEIKLALERLARTMQEGGSNRAATAAMANLADGISGLVQHMRAEQQMVRDWVERQSDQQERLHRMVERLSDRMGYFGRDRDWDRVRERERDRERVGEVVREGTALTDFRREG